LPSNIFGHTFANPIGLAAGMDKRADALLAWEELGFGWVEYGGITAMEQPGNPKPRMFRASSEQALVNRMGFNNPGCEAITKSLEQRKQKQRWPTVPIAANIGRSKLIDNDAAEADYNRTLTALWPYADMFVINVSSPNTPDLRALQDDETLTALLSSLTATEKNLATKNGAIPKPLLVKIAPDLTDDQILAIADAASQSDISGIVATNTTTTRPNTTNAKSAKVFAETGGLSGRPLRQRADDVCKLIYRHTSGNLPIIGVGGIDSGPTAWQRIASGASLLQLYSGLIFQGADLPGKIVDHLVRELDSRGMSTIEEAIGCEAS
jgi:dihydroorotate dehydrogenase